MKQDKLYGDGHHGHNVHYLATAYSFEGRYDDAVEAARELLTYKENPRVASSADYFMDAYSQGWIAMLRTQVQFQKWDVILDGQTLPVFPRARQEAWRHWARALALANTGNVSAADEESRLFEQSLTEFRNKTHRPDPAELQVARKEMAGQLEVARGHVDRGLKLLESASKAERHLTYTEPPYYPRPVAEAMGELAMKNNKNTLAQKAFKIALEQYPADTHAETALKALLESKSGMVAGN